MTPVELCVRMMNHAVFVAEKTQDKKASEVKQTLAFFFTDEEIKRATDIVCGRAPATNDQS